MGKAFRGNRFLHRQHLFHLHRGEQPFFIFTVFLVGTFQVNTQEPIKFDYFSRGNKFSFGIGYIYGGHRPFQLGICHLRSDGAFPDQIVQTLFLGSPPRFMLVDVSRPDGFVCFLCTFGFRCIFSDFQVILPVLPDDLGLGGVYGKGRQIKGVRPHIGYPSRFV
ncbi:hypothetical protein SDC9_63109 [bioreactor metagenome]|uniref:Uncharacterized protein n=1 Tax=bioreactor metagenome TaxID=1076179 RepID=A0A644XLW6_9ZZZZ